MPNQEVEQVLREKEVARQRLSAERIEDEGGRQLRSQPASQANRNHKRNHARAMARLHCRTALKLYDTPPPVMAESYL